MGKKVLFFIALLLISPLILTTFVLAQGNDNKKTVVLEKGEVVNKDYFAAGDNVTLAGTVNGDAYIAGGNVIMEGTVNGDLIAAGGTVDIRGNVSQNLRVVGGQVNISGTVGRNISVAGGSINIGSGTNLAGNLVIGAGNLTINSPVAKDVTLGAGQVTLGSEVGGNVTAGVGELILTPNAKINGNLDYWSSSQANIQQGATVSGRITQNVVQNGSEEIGRNIGGALAAIRGAISLANFIAYLVVGLVLLRLFPLFTWSTANLIAIKFWQSLGIGLLAVIFIPILILILLITVLGIPLGLVLLALFLLVIFLSNIFVSLWIGKIIFQIFSKKDTTLWVFVAGLLVYSIITFIPIIGGTVSALATLLGLGVIILSLRNNYQQLKAKNLV